MITFENGECQVVAIVSLKGKISSKRTTFTKIESQATIK